MRRLTGRMGRSLALSAALAAAACATMPKSTLPRVPKPPKPTAADYEPARRAIEEMWSVRRNPARMQAIEGGVRQRLRQTLDQMQGELLREQEKANAEGSLLAPVLGSKLPGYPPVLRSDIIEHYREYTRLFMEANSVAGEILNQTGHKGRVAQMVEEGKPIVHFEAENHRFQLNLDPGTEAATVVRIKRALERIGQAFEANEARANDRLNAYAQSLVDKEVELADRNGKIERANDELRKKMDGLK